MEKIGCPPRAPPSRKPQIFWGFGYPRGKPLLEKIGCPPRTPLSRKSLLFIRLFYPLIQVNTSIKPIYMDKNIHITYPIQRTRKEKADIQKYK